MVNQETDREILQDIQQIVAETQRFAVSQIAIKNERLTELESLNSNLIEIIGDLRLRLKESEDMYSGLVNWAGQIISLNEKSDPPTMTIANSHGRFYCIIDTEKIKRLDLKRGTNVKIKRALPHSTLRGSRHRTRFVVEEIFLGDNVDENQQNDYNE